MLVGDALYVVGRFLRKLAETHEHIGKFAVGVHGHVAGDVVEDVRLRKVIQLLPIANGDGRRECTLAEAVKENIGWHVAADRLGRKTAQRRKKAIHIVELWHGVWIEG